MTTPNVSPRDPYDASYRDFDSPLSRQMRREAYDEDIGQHSWVRAEEVRRDVERLELSPTSRFVDLGCGPCGPLSFILASVRCTGTGVDVSPSGLRAGRARAASLGVDTLLSVQEADLNATLPFESASFDAAMSLDVVPHLRDRSHFFREVARILIRDVIPNEVPALRSASDVGRNRDRPDREAVGRAGGRFLFTDAAVITGSVSNDEIQRRSPNGNVFVAPGWNERLLESAGFRIIEIEDRTSSVLENASGRLRAMEAHRSELEQASGVAEVDARQAYLETVVDVSRRGAVSRFMYLAEVIADHIPPSR
jgi:SAM-dependent methyltransferase